MRPEVVYGASGGRGYADGDFRASYAGGVVTSVTTHTYVGATCHDT